LEEIEPVAKEFIETLKTRKILFNNIQNELPNEEITLLEFKDILTNNYHIGETDALMTARYIYEEDDIDSEGKVLFDELKQLDQETLVERLQKFIRLNNTVEPYTLTEEESNKEIDEEIYHESVEAIEENLEQADQKQDDEVEEEIEDNYSDAIEDFKEDKINSPVEDYQPTKNSPKIEEEEPEKPAYQSEPQKEPEKEPEESEIGEEEGLDIAEKCFSKMAEAMKRNKTTTINHFKDYISSQVVETEEGQEFEIVYIPPIEFLQGIEKLGLNLTEQEIKCLMIILVKPELDNVILVQDLCMVMENFGIEEDIDDITEGESSKKNESPDSKRSKVSFN